MSLLSNILKIGGAGLSAAAVPFTGGASGALLPGILAGSGAAAGGLGSVLSGAAQGSANQRGADNNQAAQRNALLAQLYNINQNATSNALHDSSVEKLAQGNQALDQKKFALTAPSVRASQSVRGSILQNAQPVTLSGLPDRVASHVPTISGGLSPSVFNADTRALGGELTRKALVDQLAGDTFDPMTPTDFSGGVLPQPKLEDFSRPGGALENTLGTTGLIASILGSLGQASDAYKQRRASTQPSDQNGWG